MNVLLTGSTGYIGRRLKRRLMKEKNIRLRLFVRNAKKLHLDVKDKAEIVEGDTFSREALMRALKGIDTAYYLVHSMACREGDYAELDRISAANFRDTCIASGVRRIIYLGGLGVKETASKHLRSRIETGEILSAEPGKIQTIWFRAGVIIGSGGASFEILRNLVEKLPVMITPKWVRTLTQPIAVGDVLEYLALALHLKSRKNLMVDIGCEKMSFGDMLERAAKVFGLKRIIIQLPLLSIRLSSLWLVLFTPVPHCIASELVKGLKSETVIRNDNAKKFFPGIRPVTFEKALHIAVEEVERNEVISRWADSTRADRCDIRLQDDVSRALLRDRKEYHFKNVPPSEIFNSIQVLGGEHGWFTYGIFWNIRGVIDKLLGGYGLNRGRRDRTRLRIGDSLDFWKVADLVPGRRLLLLAQMKLPGKGWLEFVIEDETLVQTAYFIPRGVWGRIYWFSLLPIHCLIFYDMIYQIVKRARRFHLKAVHGVK